MIQTVQAERQRPQPPAALQRQFRGPRGWFKDPWRKPRALQLLAWGYSAWSLLPVAIAILISFNAGRSNGTLQGFSVHWWYGAPGSDPKGSLFTDPDLHDGIIQSVKLSIITTIIAVPLGVAFAIGIDRWHSRPAKIANFAMLVSFVVPEIIIGTAMFLTFNFALKFIRLGTVAEVLGLVTYQISFPVIIVRARLLSIGKEYENAAMDLGANPQQAVRRVLLPLLYPAIFASLPLVIANVVDDFVTVNYLSGFADTQPLSVKIYSAVRAAPTPEFNAAATFLLVTAMAGGGIGLLLYRYFSRGEKGAAADLATRA
jgi:spermidine/putrescine transport system permease protein